MSVSEVLAGPPEVPGGGQALQGCVLARDWATQARQPHWLPHGKLRTPSDLRNDKCPVKLMRAWAKAGSLRKEQAQRGHLLSPRFTFLLLPKPLSRPLDGNTGGCSVIAQVACVFAPVSRVGKVVKYLVGWQNALGTQACCPICCCSWNCRMSEWVGI